jgi:hypothetical protein
MIMPLLRIMPFTLRLMAMTPPHCELLALHPGSRAAPAQHAQNASAQWFSQIQFQRMSNAARRGHSTVPLNSQWLRHAPLANQGAKLHQILGSSKGPTEQVSRF